MRGPRGVVGRLRECIPAFNEKIVPAHCFSLTEEKAFLEGDFHSPPQDQVKAAESAGFSKTGFSEKQGVAGQFCPVTGHMFQMLEASNLPEGSVMFKAEHSFGKAHCREMGKTWTSPPSTSSFIFSFMVCQRRGHHCQRYTAGACL